jgi:hypothetical protein
VPAIKSLQRRSEAICSNYSPAHWFVFQIVPVLMWYLIWSYNDDV